MSQSDVSYCVSVPSQPDSVPFADRYPHELLCVMETPSIVMLWTRYTLWIPLYILSVATEGDNTILSYQTAKVAILQKNISNGKRLRFSAFRMINTQL